MNFVTGPCASRGGLVAGAVRWVSKFIPERQMLGPIARGTILVADLQPFPAWNADGLLDSSNLQPEQPVQPVDALAGFFTLCTVIGVRVALAIHQGQQQAARILGQ